MSGGQPLLAVEGLSVAFDVGGEALRAVESISFELAASRSLALVGESGSGKSVTALSLLRLIDPPGRIIAGKILFRGEDLLVASPARVTEVRGDRIAMVFQEPMTALNPVMRIGAQVGEPLLIHRGASQETARARALELLGEVGIPSPAEVCDAYPHQLSGGMRQRAMIAMALCCDPEVLIADEPTTALDVTIQSQLLALLRRLQREREMALLFITHDLSLLPSIADEVAVIYAGRIVERGVTESFVRRPRHPYADALKRCLPGVAERGEPLPAIPGAVPGLGRVPNGCAFAPRCERAQERCADERPELSDDVACFFPLGGEVG